MPTKQDNINAALDLLPPAGEKVEFDTYKGQLYGANPDGGKEAFTHILKNNLVNRELSRNEEGKPIVLLSRKS